MTTQRAAALYDNRLGNTLSQRLAAVGGRLDRLRVDIRRFIDDYAARSHYQVGLGVLAGHDPEFSRALGANGWIGMTVPSRYGGAGRTALERYVVLEELLMAGAPVGAHWAADAQCAPNILRYGTELQRRRYLPEISAGRMYVSLGMSEPDSGSDLASLRMSAKRQGDGWVLDGTKVWTSNAHLNTHITVLCRTGPAGPERRDLSQFIVELSAPGVTITPIPFLDGNHHFNQVVFDHVQVPDSQVLGAVGDGWAQVLSELALERSGPDRFLSTYPLFAAFVKAAREHKTVGRQVQHDIGHMLARYRGLRRLSMSVAAELDAGNNPGSLAALVKDVGTRFEQEIADSVARLVADCSEVTNPELLRLSAVAVVNAPAFTIRGGTTEILRSIIGKELTK